MKRVVANMVFSLERVRQYVFFLSIFALPWQTRWFQEGPSLGGFPWEQGRISFYASWILILLGAALTGIDRLRPFKEKRKGEDSIKKSIWSHEKILLIIGSILVLSSCLHSVSLRATVQWGMQWFVLLLLHWTTWDLRPRFVDIGRVFLLSLVPSILIGCWQYRTQFVQGLKWFGIASQNPIASGVSVVATGTDRVLRTYGIFPHPNIFAAWLVVGILIAFFLLLLAKKRFEKVLMFLFLSISSTALLLTFSRAALIALIFGGIIFVCFASVRRAIRIFPHRQLMIGFSLFVLMIGAGFFQTRSLWFVRVATNTRLEQRSVNERTQALKDGMVLFRTSPWLGVGPGAVLYAVEKRHPSIQIPPVPPHFVPLVILDELGALGIIGFLFMLLSKKKWMSEVWSLKGEQEPWVIPLGASIFSALFVLGLLDHYLWTLWSGISLISLCFLLLMLQTQKEP